MSNSCFNRDFLISLLSYGTICPGPLCLRTYHVRSPWAWRNWLSVGSTSSRFAAPPIPPPRLWYHAFRNLSLEGVLGKFVRCLYIPRKFLYQCHLFGLVPITARFCNTVINAPFCGGSFTSPHLKYSMLAIPGRHTSYTGTGLSS